MSVTYMQPYNRLNSIVTEREPFNEELIYFRENEDIKTYITNLLKGLEVINGIKFLDCSVEDMTDIYENKLPDSELTDEQKANLEKLTKWNKGVIKSENTSYPLTSINHTRLKKIRMKMQFTDSKTTEVGEYEIFYPELIDSQYFYINGNKFFSVLQLDDAEYYRTSGNAIVLKTIFMPLKIRGLKDNFMDQDDKINGGIPVKARKLELCLFDKNINIFNYYFAKFGLTATLKFFSMEDYVEIVPEKVTSLAEEEGVLRFGLTSKFSLRVSEEWFLSNPVYHTNLVYTFITVFRRKNISLDKLEDLDYWKRQLGKHFTTNTTKTLERSHSVILSLERILDETTKSNMRHSDVEKQDAYHIMRTMMMEFENIIRMDTHNLANKRIRLTEYLIYPLIKKMSTSVYRLVTLNNPSVAKMKQIFSNISPDFIIQKLSTINLLRYSSTVNTVDLFTRILKGSKGGPQSHSTDNGSPNLGLRGFDRSYLGKICLVSTGSGDPGISLTLTPFAEVVDPNNEGKFFFADKPLIKDFGSISYEDLPDIEIEDMLVTEDEFGSED